ncbi:MAG: hypothetical protein AAB571_00270 [Chloroflexota bacterium]
MAEESKAKQEEQLPVGIKLFDNVWLLLALGFLVPGVLYLAWGVWDVLTIPVFK